MSTTDQLNSSDEQSFEWFDTYRNAYRIAYENHSFMKRWLTKISFIRLVQEIDENYLEKINFPDEKKLIKDYLKESMERNDPIPMVRAYTEKTAFVTKLNEDLADIGSDFRFHLTFSMSNGTLKDNDPPKDFGQFIYAAILSHHSKLDKYRSFLGKTYRGMNIKPSDLDQYQPGKFILTRTFLSSSTDQTIAKRFLTTSNENLAVICIYHIRDRSSTLDVQSISRYPDEREILLIPFVTFQIISLEKNVHGISFVQLDQCITD